MEYSSAVQAIADRFPIVSVARAIAGHAFTLACVRDQDALLAGITDEAEIDRFPFGLLLWASALGLSERLAEEPELVRGKRVLEIGAGGVGLPSLVAAQVGAASVLQTDYHDESLALLAHNAGANGFTEGVQQARADWRDFPPIGQPFDIVLGSDVLYERSLHEPLLKVLPDLLVPGGLLLLSDPIRPQALSFMERLEKEAIKDWHLPVTMTGRRVTEPDGTVREVALFAVRKHL